MPAPAAAAERRLALILHADDPFRAIHNALVDVDVDWSGLTPDSVPEPLLEMTRTIWLHRVQTEFRSIQVMTRFLQEVLGAGDPMEVYAGAADAVVDEIRHTALCVGVVEALGVAPTFPDPVFEPENPQFLALPMVQRALGTAVSMLAISETLSVALLEDLRARATHPTIKAVLDATLADEDTHQDFGWSYVAASLQRCDEAGLEFARLVAATTLEPYVAQTQAILADIPMHRRHLEAWPEPDLAALGMMGSEREALVTLNALTHTLRPKLRELGLAADFMPEPAIKVLS